MDVGSLGNVGSLPRDDGKADEKGSQRKIEEKKLADKEAEKRKKAEEALLNPVDKAQVTDQTHALGQSIAMSIIGSVLG